MKNATTYARKTKKMLGAFRTACPAPEQKTDPVRVLIRSILEAEAPEGAAEKALERIEGEFLDFNELRAAPAKDIVDCVGRDLPGASEKGDCLLKVLNAIFHRVSGVSVDYMRGMSKRDLRRHLHELGLDHYAAARLVSVAFDGHAIAVDRLLIDSLELAGLIHPGSDASDVQGFLERIIPHKDALAAHQALREFVAKSAPALAKKRKADAAAARKAAEAAAKKAAAAQRKEAAARAAAEERAAKKAAKEKAAKKKAKEAAKKKAKEAAKKKARRPARKTVKTVAKKATKKVAKKTAKKAAKRKSASGK